MKLRNMGLFLYAAGFVVCCGMILHCAAESKVHYFEFYLTESNFTRLCSTKTMLTVNGSFPGPVIRVRKGDTIYVNVHNQGSYGVTMHWHGVKNPRNPWSDGPEYVTQCPIPPGTNFTQEVIFSTEEGTVWWHAHSDWTRVSVHGAIVALPALGTTYPFPQPDAEEIIVLASWYKHDVMEMMKKTLDSGIGLANVSDAYTINGQPGDLYPCSKETTYRLMVDYGKTYLLRIVNAALNQDLFFMISEHHVTVVGGDGSYFKPLTTPYILLSPGQTMDVLVTADKPLGEYYIVATPYFDGEADIYDHSTATAILEYRGNYNHSLTPSFPYHMPNYNDTAVASLFTSQIRSLATPEHPVDVPLDVTTRMYFVISMNMLPCQNDSCAGPDGYRMAAALNNKTFKNPQVDILQAYYWNLSGIYESDFPDQPLHYFNFTALDLMSENVTISDPGARVKVLNYNETVEIVFQGTNIMNSAETHPIHLHGYKFYVVGRGHGIFDNETDPKNFNLYDPPELNTIPNPKDGWTAIRFKASNPGVWFMHCHLDKHMSWGMDTAFIVKSGGTAETSMKGPPAYMPPCNLGSFLGSKDSMLLRED
ncbi:hypothetical protein PVL29_024366 [Vitis rotundifolia]|uniref:Laccase n=1 Tax=Vitis rotundifolia TaxID=103349 RepID=A0AA38YRS0_VITRO|nr:hypothetical protein PVL29_024366 [Vitis rotundifolia]